MNLLSDFLFNFKYDFLTFIYVKGRLGTKHPWVKGIQECRINSHVPYQRHLPWGDNYEIANQFLHKSSSRGLKFVQKVCSKEGPRPFKKGDHYEIAKIH